MMENFPHYDTQIELILQRITHPNIQNKLGTFLEEFLHFLEASEANGG